MILLTNIASLVTVDASGGFCKTGPAMRDIGEIKNAAILFEHTIRWIGSMEEWNSTAFREWVDVDGGEAVTEEIDCTGMTVMPGFVDSHTHIAFAGSRSHEFARRLSGVPYSRIAAEGGGILTTMKAVRESSLDEIVEIGATLVSSAVEHGTTTFEIKSGYGLSAESELKLLEAIKLIGDETPADVHATFLGAHDVPPEYRSSPDQYIDLIVSDMLPKVREQGIATACDVFTDIGFFTVEQSETVLHAAQKLGLEVRVHADEIANIGASQMAARLGALSADHLEHSSIEDMVAMREKGVVATLLPGTAYTLRLPYPNARTMIDKGLIVALATDCNPGSCFTENMQTILSLACINMGMSIEEAITASTLHGAHALRIGSQTGSLEVGKHADLVIYDVESYTDIIYHFGTNHVYTVFIRGEEV
ncbi:MAG: imidazolonepropionase [Ignavibacteria bacterium]|nr:imidazolonepropionase [Ignavibacteria bacterium]